MRNQETRTRRRGWWVAVIVVSSLGHATAARQDPPAGPLDAAPQLYPAPAPPRFTLLPRYVQLPSNPEVGDVPQSTVVCGMTVLPADPAIDARMVRPLSDQGTRFTIKTMPPPMCGEARRLPAAQPENEPAVR